MNLGYTRISLKEQKKAVILKERTGQLDYINIKNFCLPKEH